MTDSADRVVWHGHARDVVIQEARAFVIEGRQLFEVDVAHGELELVASIPAHVEGITISPDGTMLAGFVFGPGYGFVQVPSRVVSLRITDGVTRDFELTDYALGDVAWIDARDDRLPARRLG